MPQGELTLDEFFSGYEESRELFDALLEKVQAIGPAEMRITKSQVAFSRERAFAWAWVPDRYLSGGHAPLVLSVSLGRRDDSPRWKQVVEPAPDRFMHHLELRDRAELDAEVDRWLREAFDGAS